MSSWAIVTVAWRSAADLGRLVASMNEHLAGERAPSLVVVDNEPDPATREAAEGWAGELAYLANPGNPGYGAAANRGVAAAEREGVVILNPDCRLVDASLAALAAEAVRRGCLAGPRVVGEEGDRQATASAPPGGPWPWLGAVWPGALQPAALRRRTEPWRLARSTRVGWLAGMCVAGPRRTLLALGPFDAAIHMYGEDLDLGLRAAAAGVESWYMPDVARVVHSGRGSSAQRWPGGPEAEIARARRTILRGALGAAAERRDHRAHLLNLRLRILAKRTLRRETTGEQRHLDAALSAPEPAEPAAPTEPRR